MNSSPWSRLRTAAWLALWIHFIAGVAMALILRHGLQTNPDIGSRLTFLREHRWVWTFAWLTWSGAALSILWYFFCFARAHALNEQIDSGALTFAVILAAAGVVPDLIAESIEIIVLPAFAADLPVSLGQADQRREVFLVVHQVATALTGYLANGLYTLATIIATWFTRRSYAPLVWLSGMAVGVMGVCGSLSTLVNSVSGMLWSNAGLVPAIIIWQIGVAIHARHEHERTLRRAP